MRIQSLILAGLLGAAAASQGDVFYQSDFTGTTLADAGLTQVQLDGNSNWIINDAQDRLQNDLADGNDRASVYTTNSWQSDGGFTLEVTFLQINPGTRFAFGIVHDTFTPNATKWVDYTTAYGIGFAVSGECSGNDGQLVFTGDGSGCSVLSTNQGAIS